MTTFYKEAREFAKKYINPIAKEIDEQERFPEEVFKELGKAGYFKLMIPTELGGLGKDMQEHADACRAFAKSSATVGLCYMMHNVALNCVLSYADDNLKTKICKDIVENEKFMALAYSELGTGTHFYISDVKTEFKDNSVIFNGLKSMVTSAEFASYYLVLTPSDVEGGIDNWVFPLGSRGLEFKPSTWHGLGMRGNVSCQMAINDVELDKELRIGKAGSGVDQVFTIVASVDIITLSKILHYWEFFRQFSTFSICIVFLVFLYLLNLVSVKVFGEVEYWITIIKVMTVVAFLIVGAAIIFGATGNSEAGIHTFIQNGEKTSSAGVLGLFGVLSTAAFSFGGTEVVAVTAGESPNPKETMPKAVRQVFWRILIFYIATMLIISSIVSANDPRLLDTNNVTASPFTIVFQNIGLEVAAVIMNAVILTSVLSAANSGMYVSSRQLFSLSSHNYGPKAFKKLNTNSVPVFALTFSAIFMVLCFIFERLNPSGYYMLLSMVGIIVMIIWMVSLISQIRLRRAIVKQGKKAEDVLPYTSKTGVVGSYIALFSFATIILLQLVADYATGGFVKMSYNLVCPAVGVVMYLVFKLVTKKKFVKLEEMDIHPYKG